MELDGTGKELSRLEATNVEKKRLDDAVFAIPAGYKKSKREFIEFQF